MTIQVAQRIGRALGVSSATRLTELDTALREYVRSVGPAAATPFSGSIDAGQVVTGTFANARVAVGNVTQHQAALAIAYAQLTGVPATFAPSAHTHPNGDLTGYTAADVLSKLLTVDGAGSGLDADLLDGLSSAAFATAAHMVNGTWTPFDLSGAALAFAGSTDARYMKHENLVVASAYIRYPVTASGAANQIGGIPFAFNTGLAYQQGQLTYCTAATAKYVIPTGTTSFYILDAAGVPLTNAALSNVELIVQFTYST